MDYTHNEQASPRPGSERGVKTIGAKEADQQTKVDDEYKTSTGLENQRHTI